MIVKVMFKRIRRRTNSVLRNTKALMLQNKRSLSQGRGFRWGLACEKKGLLCKARLEGLYQQEIHLNALTLFQLRNKAGQRILRVEKGIGKDGGSAFWHKHSRPGFKHHKPIFRWNKGRK
jgi:hypothetical protein